MLRELPDELVCKVINCLPLVDRVSVACTSKSMLRLSKSRLVELNVEIHSYFEALGLVKWLASVAKESSQTVQQIELAMSKFAISEKDMPPSEARHFDIYGRSDFSSMLVPILMQEIPFCLFCNWITQNVDTLLIFDNYLKSACMDIVWNASPSCRIILQRMLTSSWCFL